MKNKLKSLEKKKQRYSYENETTLFRFNRWLNRSKCIVKFYDFTYKLTKIQYVDTDIMTINADTDRTTLVLDNGDWFTVTTKKYMNELLGLLCPKGKVYIFQKDFTWYLKINGNIIKYHNDIAIELDSLERVTRVFNANGNILVNGI